MNGWSCIIAPPARIPGLLWKQLRGEHISEMRSNSFHAYLFPGQSHATVWAIFSLRKQYLFIVLQQWV